MKNQEHVRRTVVPKMLNVLKIRRRTHTDATVTKTSQVYIRTAR